MGNTIKIAIIGNCTTDYLGMALQSAAGVYNLQAEIYNGPYNQYMQEVLNRESGLYRFAPELVILWLEGKGLFPQWFDFNLLLEGKDKKTEWIREAAEAVVSPVEHILAGSGAKVIINNFRIPCHTPLGILDNRKYPGLKAMIGLLNSAVEEWASERDRVFVFDYNSVCAAYGMDKAEDKKLYYAAKSPVSIPFANVMALEYMRYILPMKSKNKKCLVLDLDNTLWGGVAAEDGMEGIALDINGPGRCYYDFQAEIRNLYSKGILLAVNSKNNEKDALEIIENHPHMLLRKDHFSILKINWRDKVSNLREIARELNIGTDSMVFFDDNPAEREYVKSNLPEVKVVQVPEDAAKFAETLQKLPDFELLDITEDDLKRNRMYRDNIKRKEESYHFSNAEDFIKSLETEITIAPANALSIPRISQLTLKTNQFNMTTKRYQTGEIAGMADSDEYLVASCSVRDRFGDSGISGVCIVKLQGSSAVIDTFLLSCRVLGRNIEFAFLEAIVEMLRGKNRSTIFARFVRTGKNSAFEGFYSESGFSADSSDGNETYFSLGGESRIKTHDYIKVSIKSGG